MHRICIVVADSSRARLFTLSRSADVEGLHEELSEQRDLVNPARRQTPAHLFSDTRPGSGRTGGLAYAFDDHREAHLDELDAEFARAIIAELTALLRTAQIQRLIVCASPRMLGELRRAGEALRRSPIGIDEVPRDLVRFTPTELRNQLGAYGLLPPRPRVVPQV